MPSCKYLILLILVFLSRSNGNYQVLQENTNQMEEVVKAVKDHLRGDNEQCEIFKQVLDHLLDGNLNIEEYFWVIKMYDSWTKFPSGILEGNIFDRGHFDECIAIDENFNGTAIKGKYCAAAITVPVLSIPVSRSICIPDGCDIDTYPLKDVKLSNSMCQTKGTYSRLEWDDYSVIGGFAFILFLIAISTIYDSILYYSNQKAKHPLFIAFSVLTNGRKLFAVSSGSNQVACLHGIRAISLMWIIAGHRFVSVSGLPSLNMVAGEAFKNDISSSYVSSARAAVDTFFLFSAFLVSFIYFKGVKSAMAKAESKGLNHVNNPLTISKIPMFYIHRLLRITPALAAVFFTQITILRRINEGPFWPMFMDMMTKSCHKWWWSLFLYVQNYVNYDDICIVPTWYLSADMQMYILSPFLLIPVGELIIKGKRKLGYIVMLFAILLSIIIPMIIDFVREFDKGNIYETHCRLSVYTIGLLFGMIVVDFTDKKIHIPTVVNLGMWILSIGTMLAIVLTMHDTEIYPEKLKNNLYFTFTRPVWSVAICWIVFSCHFGYGGPANWLLSKSIFQITTKLSFSMYLLHNLLITLYLGGNKTANYFSQYETMYQWCGDYIFTIMLSIIWVLSFESPVVVLEKVIFGRGERQAKPNAENPTQNKTEAEIA